MEAAGSHTSFCRFCPAFCPIVVDVEDGRAVRVRGDRANALYLGYTCAKGRALPEMHAHPARLLRSRKRLASGRVAEIASDRAMDEIALRLREIIDRHGPDAVALYQGTFAFNQAQTGAVAGGWLKGIGSRMGFGTGTIDQPGKILAPALHGRWLGGPQIWDDADTWMFVGTNPTLSKLGGIPMTNAGHQLHEALRRGMQIVVIDPRRSEVARRARVHLQPHPGEDPSILAGIIRLILTEGLHDAEFVAQNARGLDDLRARIDPFTPAYVERRAGVPADALVEAARVFAGGRRGCAVAGTGPNMAPRGTLTEYLLLCINTLCGRWLRAGERVPNPGGLVPAAPPRAQPAPPFPAYGFAPRLRVRGLTNTAGGLPTAALADEILLEGGGGGRALICVGGNPMLAWPDQLKTQAALQKLDLLVVVDPKMTATARVADYVIAPKLTLEVPGMTFSSESLNTMGISWGFTVPHGQYTPAVVDPPEGADVIEDWEFFYGLAQRMGVGIRVLCGGVMWRPGDPRPRVAELDMQRKPTTEELFELLTQDARVPLSYLREYPHGAVFDADLSVAPREADCDTQLELADAVMMGELDAVSRESFEPDPEFAFRLVSRRIPDIFNSVGRDIPALTRRWRYNPAFLNPDDLSALGLRRGDVVEIRSAHASILGVVEPESGIRRGVVSMAHGFGDEPGADDDVEVLGGNTGRLIDCETDFDPYSGIPRMSAIPVHIEPRA